MKVYEHAANVLRAVRTENKGFKTAFYDYHTQNQHEVTPIITRVYSIAINTYQNMESIDRALEAVVDPNAWDIGWDDEQDLLRVFTYEACVKNSRIRMGGRIVKCIKANVQALKQVIQSSASGMVVFKKHMEPCVYVRPNLNKIQ